jgi:hypothetical protein
VPAPKDLPDGTVVKTLTSAGTFALAGIQHLVGGQHGYQQVADLDGEILIRAHPTRPQGEMRGQQLAPRHAPRPPEAGES